MTDSSKKPNHKNTKVSDETKKIKFYDLNGFKNALRQVAKTNNPSILKKDGSLKFPGPEYAISPQNWSNAINGLVDPSPETLRHVIVAVHSSLEQAEELMSYLGRNFSQTPFDQAIKQCLAKGNYKNWFDIEDFFYEKTLSNVA